MEMIVVLGGGAVAVEAEEGGGGSLVPPVYVQARCAAAAELRLERLAAGGVDAVKVLLLSAGTAHVAQPVGANGLPVWESTGSAAWLMGVGKDGGVGPRLRVPAEDMVLETTSYDTVGNAWFARIQHVDVLRPAALHIVTSAFHMSRTRTIFDFVMALDRSREGTPTPALHYVETPDAGLDGADVRARAEREARSEAAFREGVMTRCASLADLHAFIHHAHAMYSVQGLVRNALHPPALDPAVLRSYGGSRSSRHGQDEGER